MMMKKNEFNTRVINDLTEIYSVPIPLDQIAADEGIRVIYDDYGEGTFDGMTWYESLQDRFFIHINTRRGNQRDSTKGRFTLAHELGHYFIDHHREAMEKGVMKPHIHRFCPFERNADWKIEREADSFASSLLMPKNEFFNDAKLHVFSGELIQKLASKYKVSFSACALRYMNMNLVPIMLVFAEDGKIKWQMCSDDFPFRRMRYGTDKVPENTVMGDYFYNHDSSCCKQSEIVYARDCFDTYSVEQNDLEFYEYCISYQISAFSVFWQR